MKHWNKLCVLICVIVGGIVWQRNMIGPFLLQGATGDLRNFLGLISQISATMLGFLLAALAILASISGHRLIRNMQKTGHFRVLLQRIFMNVVVYGLATGAALVAYLTKTKLGIASFSAILVFFYASLLLVDVGYRFWIVLTNLNQDS